jgi:hypothetical protein
MCQEHAQNGEARLHGCPGHKHGQLLHDHEHDGDVHLQPNARVAELEGAQEHEPVTGERLRPTWSQA